MSSVSKLSPSKKKKKTRKNLFKSRRQPYVLADVNTPEARRIQIPTQKNFIIYNECIK